MSDDGSSFCQAAALAVAQHLTAESSQVEEEDDEEPVTMISSVDSNALQAYMPPPTPFQPIVTRLQKPRKMKQSQPPPLPVVAQLIEMGFPRKRVELAVKALGKTY